MPLSTSSYPVVMPKKLQFFSCYNLSTHVDGLSVWIHPICRNTGADKGVIVGSCLRYVGSYPLCALHGCLTNTPGFVAIVSAHVCKLVLLCTVYLHHNTSTHSDSILMFCYDNAVIIVF